MKFIFQKRAVKCLLLYTAILTVNIIWAQTCPPAVTTGVASINNTWFPGQQAIVSAGSTSTIIGAAAYGTIPVSAVMGGGGGAGDNKDGTGTPNGGLAPVMKFISGCKVLPMKFTAANGKRDGAQNASGETFFSKVITIQTVLSKEEMLDISPVPAKRYTMIKWSATTNSKLTITMFDATGRFVLCRQYQLRNGVNELLLTNLEALPAGVYFLKASDGASYRNGKLRIHQ